MGFGAFVDLFFAYALTDVSNAHAWFVGFWADGLGLDDGAWVLFVGSGFSPVREGDRGLMNLRV